MGRLPAELEAIADNDRGNYFGSEDIAREPDGTVVLNPENWLRRVVQEQEKGVGGRRSVAGSTIR